MGNYITQLQFNGGAVSPRASGKVDSALYQKSLKQSQNLYLTPYGSVTSRPGTQYMNACISSSVSSRLFKFIYDNSNAYVVEAADGKLRFYKNKARIAATAAIQGGDFTSSINSTYWTGFSSGTGSVAWNATSGGVARFIGNGASNEARLYTTMTYPGIGTYTIRMDVASTAVTYKIGTTAGASDVATGSVSIGTGQTFSFTATANYTVLYITFEVVTGTSDVDNITFINNPAYTLLQPYTAAQLQQLDVAQDRSTAFFVHGDVAPYLLTRVSDSQWHFTTATFTDGPYLDENTTTTTITPSATTGSVTLTASTAIFASTDVGRQIRIKSGPDLTNRLTYAGTGTRKAFDVTFFPQGQTDVEVYLVDDSAGTISLRTYTTHYTITTGQVIMVTAPTSTQRLIIQPVNAGSGSYGYVTITAYTDTTHVTATVNSTLQGTNATTYWKLGEWTSGNYPVSAAFHEQRLCLLGKSSQLWGSVSGQPTNMQPDNSLRKGTPAADSALNIRIKALEGSEGRWLISKQGLFIGTTRALVALISDASAGVGLTATTLPQPLVLASMTSNYVRPLLFKDLILATNIQQNKVLTPIYKQDVNSFRPIELSWMAEHLFRGKSIVKFCGQEFPDNTFYTLFSDGSFLMSNGKLFQIDQDDPDSLAFPFMYQTLGGDDAVVESIESIPNASGGTDVYFSVSRTINGSTVRYMEYQNNYFLNTELEDGIFTDCSLTYDDVSAIIIVGLDHLEGEEVNIIADGSVHANKTVSGGQITLDTAATTVQIGLYSPRLLQTNKILVQVPQGSGHAILKNVYECDLEVYETVGCSVGFDSGNVDPILFTEPSSPFIQSLELFTGHKTKEVESDFEQETSLYISQPDPLPMTINGITTKLKLASR